MKVLFVANRVPFPPYRGDKLKIFNLASRLHESHEIHLLTIAETKKDLTYENELKKIFHQTDIFFLPKWKSVGYVLLGLFSRRPLQVAYFRSSAFQRKLEKKLATENYDAVHVQHIRMGGFFEKLKKDRVVLDLPDAFSLYWKRRSENAAAPWFKWFAALEHKRLKRYEKKWLPRFPLNLVCSEEDKHYLDQELKANIKILPNGVDTTVFHPRQQVPELGRILFTGNMDYAPNVDAVSYFVESIFPLILEKIPGARFVIAGQRPVARVLALASPQVEVTGFIPNLAEEYAKAAVVVAPLRFGAGTQNKVLEALAMGIPVVCTQIGFKGLGITSGEGAVLATSEAQFAEETITLLSDEVRRKRVVEAGGNTIRDNFSWDAIAKKLDYFLHTL